MERRWTRKKRALRDAGGPEPKKALSGALRMVPPELPPELEAEAPPEPQAAEPREQEPDAAAPVAPEDPPEILPDMALAQSLRWTPTEDEDLDEAEAEAEPPILTPAQEETDRPEAETAPRPLRTAQRDVWSNLPRFDIHSGTLERNRMITLTREDPIHSVFDVLRTKLLRALRENGWTRVAVTSPTEGCGKTFMTANLALSLARQNNCRTVVMDFDMRHPALARVMGIADPPDLPAYLRGRIPMQDVLRRPGANDFMIGGNVAFGVNRVQEPYAAELLQDDRTADVLDELEAELEPDVMLFDMPPALVNDDVLAARPLYDGIILIVGGGITKPQQVRDVERRLGTETPLLGVVLNKSEGDAAEVYGY